ncbi:hypothetical protein BD779DRAFT_1680779 [Infundibulicybe gibba]|nr:hypothetical protein BD779DRAFT_1680779 [Infundibulicybe gibba]
MQAPRPPKQATTTDRNAADTEADVAGASRPPTQTKRELEASGVTVAPPARSHSAAVAYQPPLPTTLSPRCRHSDFPDPQSGANDNAAATPNRPSGKSGTTKTTRGAANTHQHAIGTTTTGTTTDTADSAATNCSMVPPLLTARGSVDHNQGHVSQPPPPSPHVAPPALLLKPPCPMRTKMKMRTKMMVSTLGITMNTKAPKDDEDSEAPKDNKAPKDNESPKD